MHLFVTINCVLAERRCNNAVTLCTLQALQFLSHCKVGIILPWVVNEKTKVQRARKLACTPAPPHTRIHARRTHSYRISAAEHWNCFGVVLDPFASCPAVSHVP